MSRGIDGFASAARRTRSSVIAEAVEEFLHRRGVVMAPGKDAMPTPKPFDLAGFAAEEEVEGARVLEKVSA